MDRTQDTMHKVSPSTVEAGQRCRSQQQRAGPPAGGSRHHYVPRTAATVECKPKPPELLGFQN